MKALKTIAVAAVGLSLAACSGMSINTDFNPGAPFDSYETFSWLPAPQTGDPRVDNAIIYNRVKTAVDAELEAKGYREVDSASEADFLVGYHIALDGRMDVQTVNSYYGYAWGPWYYGGYRDTYVRYYDQGTMLIDIVDRRQDELVWRGTAQAEVRENADGRQIQEAANKLLARFPPN
ncbi:MAG: DUF4136 domain-containing protein [Gemmatimonadales bacterium]|jgi:hypothetical protein